MAPFDEGYRDFLNPEPITMCGIQNFLDCLGSGRTHPLPWKSPDTITGKQPETRCCVEHFQPQNKTNIKVGTIRDDSPQPMAADFTTARNQAGTNHHVSPLLKTFNHRWNPLGIMAPVSIHFDHGISIQPNGLPEARDPGGTPSSIPCPVKQVNTRVAPRHLPHNFPGSIG